MHLVIFCVALVFFAAPPAIEAQEAAKPVAPFKLPEEKDIPGGPLGNAIRYGEKVLSQTQAYAQKYIGNGLNCTSCHLNGGKTPMRRHGWASGGYSQSTEAAMPR